MRRLAAALVCASLALAAPTVVLAAAKRSWAEAEIKLEAAAALLDSVTDHQHGNAAWSPLRALAAKEYVTTTAREGSATQANAAPSRMPSHPFDFIGLPFLPERTW